MAECLPNGEGNISLRKSFGNQMLFGTVFNRYAYAKLPCDADCRKNIIRLMRVRLKRYVAACYGQKHLQLISILLPFGKHRLRLKHVPWDIYAGFPIDKFIHM